MLNAIDIKHLTEGADIQLSDYHDCLNQIMCSEPVDVCHFNEWESYLDIDNFKSTSKNKLADTDASVEELCARLENLKPRAFYAKQQGLFSKHLRIILKEEEFIILLNFAENYIFITQNAARAFH